MKLPDRGKEAIRAPYRPFPHARIVFESDALAEAIRPCGRFRSPLSWSGRMRLRSELRALSAGPIGERLILADAAPLNWEILVRYLHAEGIIDSPRFAFDQLENDMPKRPSVRLTAHSGMSDTDGREVSRYGFGSAATAEEAMSRAVGEVLERYSLSTYRRADLIEAPYKEARAWRVRPMDIFALNDFLPWQKEMFPNLARADSRPVAWVRGFEFPSGAPVHLPAQLVYWNYRFREGEMALGEPNTNGGAGHFTRDEAILSGLLELIQRDGFLIYWLNNLPPKRIDPSTIVDTEIKDLLQYLRRYRLDAYFLNTTTDIGVPSCACFLVDQRAPGGPLVTVGGAAGFSLRELITQSAGEALAVHGGVAGRDTYRLPERYRPFSSWRVGRDERLTLWRGEEMFGRLRQFLEGPLQSFEGFIGEAAWQDTPAKRLAYIVHRLKRLGAGYEIYYREARHPALERLGYHAVKVIVPKLVSLYLRENMAPLSASRLRDVPEALGYKAAEQPNLWPHPFP
jgi:ribosomal protein S12 methylthiotransferase accessory factor